MGRRACRLTSQAYPYICEDPAPGTLVTPPTSSAPQIADVFSPQRAFHGSTQNVPNSVAGYMGCGADAAAPDAVFQFNLTYLTNVSFDITGSFPGAVVGLFKSTIGDQG